MGDCFQIDPFGPPSLQYALDRLATPHSTGEGESALNVFWTLSISFTGAGHFQHQVESRVTEFQSPMNGSL